MKQIRIVNIIASGKIRGNFDIEKIAKKLTNVQYEPEIFPGLILRNTEFNYTTILFYSGKISSHGCKSISQAKKAIMDTIIKIKSLNCIIGNDEIMTIKIENIVGVGSYEKIIDISKLKNILGEQAYIIKIYYLIYRSYNNSIVCLIFKSGKIIIMGANNCATLLNVYNNITNKIKSI